MLLLCNACLIYLTLTAYFRSGLFPLCILLNCSRTFFGIKNFLSIIIGINITATIVASLRFN